MFPHPCLYASNFNSHHVDWDYDDNSLDGECLAGWASINCLALLCNAKDAANFYSGCWNTGTNPNLTFVNNINLHLLHHQGLLWQCRVCLLIDGNSARLNRVITLLRQINLQRLFCHLTHLMWMQLTRTFVTSSRKQPKRLLHAGFEMTVFCAGMQNVNLSIELSCSLLRETTQVWLLQLCLPSLTV